MNADETQLVGGWWNVERDRNRRRVAAELERLAQVAELDWLGLEEWADYAGHVQLPGWTVYSSPEDNHQNALAVRDGVEVDHVGSVDLAGDGWTTGGGDHHVPPRMFTGLLGGWLRVGVVHMPVALDWSAGKPGAAPDGPAERVDDYVANMRALEAYADRRRHTHRGLAIGGDWNAHWPREVGKWTPAWLARHTHLELVHPVNRNPAHTHPAIDYALVDGDVELTAFRYTVANLHSDHAPVVGTFRRRT